MADTKAMDVSDDPFNLHRFVEAQAGDYPRALGEIRSGRKRSHWMWYIFPQYAGLGFSAMSQRYAIRSLAEAEAYRDHPVLGPRLRECAEAAVEAAIGGVGRSAQRSALDIFGSPDDRKLQSCATLFAQVTPAGSVFERLLDTFFGGERDAKTLQFIGDG